MDPATASYYRAVLFVDRLDDRPLPPTLVQLHSWAVKRNQALGLGGMITKATALAVAMTWLSSTKDGRAFAREFTPIGDLFDEPTVAELWEPAEISAEEWDALPAGSEVLVTMYDGAPRTAKFVERRGGWIDAEIDGDVKHFRTSKVKLPAGV